MSRRNEDVLCVVDPVAAAGRSLVVSLLGFGTVRSWANE